MTQVVPTEVLLAFAFDPGAVAEPLGQGHIHRTFALTEPSGRWVLQQLNHHIFSDLDAVVSNAVEIARQRVLRRPELVDRSPRRTISGELLASAPDGSRWRATPHVAGLVPAPSAPVDQVRAASRAFGQFVADLDHWQGRPLIPTVEGFHDLDLRRRQLAEAVEDDRMARSAGGGAALADLENDLGAVLGPVADTLAATLRPRLVHNDAKLANVVLDPNDLTTRAVIDCDTTMTGTVVADVGELVRSSVTGTAEDRGSAPGPVDLHRFGAVVEGFVAGCDGVLDEDEVAGLSWAGAILSYENGIRFLADHIDGDHYFPVTRPGQNLDRARRQLWLAEQLVEAQPALSRIVAGTAGTDG